MLRTTSIGKPLPVRLPGTNGLSRYLIPGLVAVVALTVAVIGAFLTRDGTNTGGVNGFVEGLSGDSGSFLDGIGFLAPLGFAFAAGMVSAVNPCGFAMLPAYLGLYLGSNEQGKGHINPIRQLGRALLVGGVVTIGSRVPGSGVRGRGSGERETTASSLAGKEESSRKEDNSGQGKDGPAGAIAQGGNGR